MSSRKKMQFTDEQKMELESGFSKGLTNVCAENIEIEDSDKQLDFTTQVVKVCDDVTKMQQPARVDIRCIYTLDWTTGLSYFPFLDKLIPMLCKIVKYLATKNDFNNDNGCLLQCIQQCTKLTLRYSHLINRAHVKAYSLQLVQ